MLLETAKIQAKGGVPISKKNKTKLKSPGGIFLKLFKQNCKIKKKTKKEIIRKDRKKRREEKRMAKFNQKFEELFNLG